MARKTIKVEIPRNAEDKLILLDKVVAKNEELGDDSPVKGLPMGAMKTLTATAHVAQDKSKDLERLAKIQTATRDNAFGTAQTENTAIYILTQVRDLLLSLYKSNPQQLGEWGFDVQEGETVTHRAASKK